MCCERESITTPQVNEIYTYRGVGYAMMTDSERDCSPYPLNHRTPYQRECELISDSVIGELFFV